LKVAIELGLREKQVMYYPQIQRNDLQFFLNIFSIIDILSFMLIDIFYCKAFYNQRNKDETIIPVIKRLFGEHNTSRLVRTQNSKLSFRCIGYNMQRLTNLIILLMVSTKPIYA